MSTRREKIEAMLADDPDDVFLRYGLALELDKEGLHEESLAALHHLVGAGVLAGADPYVPAYFMAAQQLVRLERVEEARGVLRTGIEEARRQQNSHAAGEMAEFLASVGRT